MSRTKPQLYNMRNSLNRETPLEVEHVLPLSSPKWCCNAVLFRFFLCNSALLYFFSQQTDQPPNASYLVHSTASNINLTALFQVPLAPQLNPFHLGGPRTLMDLLIRYESHEWRCLRFHHNRAMFKKQETQYQKCLHG